MVRWSCAYVLLLPLTCNGNGLPPPSKSIVDFLRSIPTVARVEDTNRPSENLVSTAVLPTPLSPNSNTFTGLPSQLLLAVLALPPFPPFARDLLLLLFTLFFVLALLTEVARPGEDSATTQCS